MKSVDMCSQVLHKGGSPWILWTCYTTGTGPGSCGDPGDWMFTTAVEDLTDGLH